jgi:hypothetical protein
MILKVYGRIIAGLGGNYDLAQISQEMRLNHWLEPVFKKLEEKFPRFLKSNVEEKLEEMNSASFDNLLNRMSIEVVPRYPLRSIKDKKVSPEPKSSTLSSSYPVWDQANFVSKLLRNTISNIDVYTVENKIVRTYQSALALRMRGLAKPLEKLAMLDVVGRNEREIRILEDMLNLGQDITAAIYSIWHVSSYCCFIFITGLRYSYDSCLY